MAVNFSESRAGKAGEALADAIFEMVNLMSNRRTGRNFFTGLIKKLVSNTQEFEHEEEAK